MLKKLNQIIGNLNNYKKIIFDCDGVIFDSNKLKEKIFKKILIKQKLDKRIISRFINYHNKHLGMSRYKKFEYLEKRILKNKNKNINKKLNKIYSNETIKMYLNKAKYVPHVINFIKLLKRNYQIPCYILSGSNQRELRYIFKKKNISKYFKNIYGSPKNKYELVSKNKLNLSNGSEVLYFGDAKYDFNIAKYFSFQFILVNSKLKKISKKNYVRIINFKSITSYLKKSI